MFDLKNSDVKKLIFKGNFGLEKESLRITEDGRCAQSLDPFVGEKHIVRDFSENMAEINTGVCATPEEAIKELEFYTEKIQKTLAKMQPREYLWPNSNPPYIKEESEIPMAVFEKEQMNKAVYREYLAVRYGRYKMTYCGIHVNYSFGEELLKADFLCSGMLDYRAYKDRLYLKLAENLAAYGWLVTMITAASADMDASFFEKGKKGKTTFFGMGTVRCGEFGFWNQFVPIFDYTSLSAYIKSIRRYVDKGFIAFASELYYPIRLKPPGENNLSALGVKGVDHIELRNVDLNPMTYASLDVRDLKFIQLFLIWLVSIPRISLSEADQIQAVQNFKNAARFDLDTVNIVSQDGIYYKGNEAALNVIQRIKDFYAQNFEEDAYHNYSEILEIINYEEEKFLHPEKRYCWQLHQDFQENFFEKNLEIAKKMQDI